MKKICFPHYSYGEFDSLHEAFTTLKAGDRWNSYMLADIVQYNVCYRDYLRSHGVDALLRKLIAEAPELEHDEALEYLRAHLKKVGPIGDYDIQCYPIMHQFTLFGHTFHGLADIYEYSRRYRNIEEVRKAGLSVYVQAYHECYPQFDSFDACDNRTYQNYIVSDTSKPIKYWSEKSKFGRFPSCMVHEEIEKDTLPILYYPGDGRYFLLATAKEPTRMERMRRKCVSCLGQLLKKCLSLCGYSVKVRRVSETITIRLTKNKRKK